MENSNSLNNYYKKYNKIIIKNNIVLLNKPIDFYITQDEIGVYFENKDLNIYASGRNFIDAEKNMYEELLMEWELYANEDNSKLTDSAISIKNNLRSIVNLDDYQS